MSASKKSTNKPPLTNNKAGQSSGSKNSLNPEKRVRKNSEHTQYATAVTNSPSVLNPMEALKAQGQELSFSIHHSKSVSAFSQDVFEHNFQLVQLKGEDDYEVLDPALGIKAMSEKETISHENTLLRVETTQLVSFLKGVCAGMNSATKVGSRFSFAGGARFIFSHSLEPCMEPSVETETIISSVCGSEKGEEDEEPAQTADTKEANEGLDEEKEALRRELEELRRQNTELRKENQEMRNLMRVSAMEVRKEKEKLKKKEVKLGTVLSLFGKFFKVCHKKQDLIDQAISALEIPENLNAENRPPKNSPRTTPKMEARARVGSSKRSRSSLPSRQLGKGKRRGSMNKEIRVLSEKLKDNVQRLSSGYLKGERANMKNLRRTLKVVQSVLVCVKKEQLDDILKWFKTESGLLEVIKEEKEE